MATKAQEIYDQSRGADRVGYEKADAFKQLAEDDGPPVRLDPWELLLPQETDRGR